MRRGNLRQAARGAGLARLRAGVPHDAGDLRRRAAAQRRADSVHARPRLGQRPDRGRSLPNDDARGALAATPRDAHPRRHRAARDPEAHRVVLRVDRRLAGPRLLPGDGRLRHTHGVGQLQVGRDDHQDPGHARMVAARAAAGDLRPARARDAVPHAAPRARRARAARGRGVGGLTMSWQFAAWLMLGGSTLLLFLGLPVAFTFIAVNIVGAVIWLGGEPGLEQLARNSVISITSFSLTPIPLFVLMGEVLFHTGIAVKVIDGVERLIAQVPGRLAVVAVVAGTIFSAISGSTIATTAMLGSLMVPVMLSRGYHPSMATGPIMAIGAVDMLIPPSALTVLLGSLSGISISKLLIGGVLPGLMLSVAFVAYIIVRAQLTPSLAPPTPIVSRSGWENWRLLVLYVLPLVGIFAVVVGAMSGGFATPTESAALGALATMLVAALYRALSLKALMRSLKGATAISGMIMFIILGATTLSQILSFSGATEGLVYAILGQGLSPWAVVALMMLILIFLGIFIDQVSMMLITLPVFMPIVARLGIDPVWFGILFLICMQLGLLLPPHGLLLMTMRGVAPPEVTMMHIFQAVVPYIVMSLMLLALLLAFPLVATWLPNRLIG